MRCVNCGMPRNAHHYNCDGPGSGFLYQDRRLYCPAGMGVFEPADDDRMCGESYHGEKFFVN